MNSAVDNSLAQEMAAFGARDMDLCMQCGTCSASCPLSRDTTPFPRKIYRYIQLGLRDKLLASPEPWLCYYCGECNLDCPRGAEPAETMMAARRWLTANYDWTGLARKFYLSEAWEIGALLLVALGVILLFVVGHGPIVTERVAVNSFAPVVWIEIGDLVMAAVLTTFLLSNAFRMYRRVMQGTRVPVSLYLTEARTFLLHFLTQKRWQECGPDRRRWARHLILVSGYLTMMTLVIVFIRWFQVDDSSWHFTSLFGYYATAVLLIITVEMFRSRRRKEAAVHRYSEFSDWLFLILLFLTTLTGIVMHLVRLAGWPMGTYVMYVVHLAVAVPMLVVEVPFGKWSHLFYRPLAIFLAAVREKAVRESEIDPQEVAAMVDGTFQTCLQCGTCTSLCPLNAVSAFSPRAILRRLAMGDGSRQQVDQPVWDCLTCNLCGENCPRGIDIIDVMHAVRALGLAGGRVPDHLAPVLQSLAENGNPWGADPARRGEWAAGLPVPAPSPGREYGLFTCCTSAYDPDCRDAARALPQLLALAGVSHATFGGAENCCGDPAHAAGEDDLQRRLVARNTRRIVEAGVEKILAVSPHCLHAFNTRYPGLPDDIGREHYTRLLDRLTADGRLRATTGIDRVVTYHDPCYLGRHGGIYDPPRRVLQRIPGLHLVEMANHREMARCCGGGGGGAWNGSADRERFGELRVQEALESGAEIIATACPYCIRTLKTAVRRLRLTDRIAVRDVAELLLESSIGTAETEAAAPGEGASGREACHV